MDESIVSVFDNMVILNNYKLVQHQNTDFECKKWIDEIKRIQAMYNINIKHKLNKTFIFGYQTTSSYIIPFDVLMNQYDLIIPRNITSFVDFHLISIVNYIIQNIKLISSYEIANEINYKLSIYLPITHGDNMKIKTNQFFGCWNSIIKKTKLDRVLTEDYYRYDMVFKFTPDWNITP